MSKYLREKIINRQQPQIIQMLNLLDKYFKVAVLSMLCKIRMNVLEMNGKIELISKETESIKM